MILSKMLKQCKKNKHIQIITYGEHEYLSSGKVAGYIDADVEEWTAEDCAAAIGIPADVRDMYIYAPIYYPELTNLTYAAPMSFYVGSDTGTIMYPFRLTDERVFFVDMELLKIFDEVKDKHYYFKEAQSEDETGLLVIMSGTFAVGVIPPMRVNLNGMSAFAADLLTGLNASEEAEFLDAGGQMEIRDPVEAESEETK